jgi:hypothetical protein
MRGISAIFLVFAFVLPAAAQSSSVYGFGIMSCHSWTETGENRAHLVVNDTLRSGGEMWTLGYLSAANVYDLQFRFGSPLTPDLIFSWMDAYCRMHPEAQLIGVVKTMIAGARTPR